jgi:hypothetical protein
VDGAAARLALVQPRVFDRYAALVRAEARALRAAVRASVRAGSKSSRKMVASVRMRARVSRAQGVASARVFSAYFKLRLWETGFDASSVPVKAHDRIMSSGRVARVREYVRHTPLDKTAGRKFFDRVWQSRHVDIDRKLRDVINGVRERV